MKNYKQYNLKRSYISRGNDNIARSFLSPILKSTKLYQRSVGYFSSNVFETIIDGIEVLVKNKGKIELIASPKLSKEDVEVINIGYQKREAIAINSFSKDFIEEMEKIGDKNLKLFLDLIAKNILDIKIAITDTAGDYHDKLGILRDFEEQVIVFYGSANSSLNGYKNNYEKIRIVRSWMPGEEDNVRDEIEEFESLWNGTNEFVNVYEFKETAQKNLLEIVDHRLKKQQKKEPIKLRDYQKEAIDAWVANDFHGFYVMATGTGKTWTAIYSAKKLLEQYSAMIVICAPYKHLIKQWAEDVRKVFQNALIILVSSENSKWEEEISKNIVKKKFHPEKQIIIISTIASFRMERFIKTIRKSNEDKLLIVDEAHRFTHYTDEYHQMFKYMLGLSATPFNGNSAQKGKELLDFFGGQVFNLPIEKALEYGFLVPYSYYPIFVDSTESEEDSFTKYTRKMASCFKNNRCVNKELQIKSYRARLRVISMAEEKENKRDEILSYVKENDHFIVYCGDGKLFDNNGKELRHIQAVKKTLSKNGYKPSQFTAKENIKERMEIVETFNNGAISTLVAIRCLDEGINIPSIESALILSSNDSYREFVQRRGRILRQYRNKKSATIYDVIVLPSIDLEGWAKIELRRFYEYAKLAQNWDDLSSKLVTLLHSYGLNIEDVDVYNYEEMEDDIDE